MAVAEFDLQSKYEQRKEEDRLKAKGIVEDKKRIVQVIKLYAPAATARSGPPLGPVLGQHQLNINDFCKEFNKLTAQMNPRLTVPVFLYKKADKTFDLQLRDVSTPFYFSLYRQLRSKYQDQKYFTLPLNRLRYIILTKHRHLTAKSVGISLAKATKIVVGSAQAGRIGPAS